MYFCVNCFCNILTDELPQEFVMFSNLFIYLLNLATTLKNICKFKYLIFILKMKSFERLKKTQIKPDFMYQNPSYMLIFIEY